MGDVNAMGLSLDTTYGSDVFCHKWFEVSDFKASPKWNYNKNEMVSSLGVKHSTHGIFEVTGSFNMMVFPNYHPYILMALMGGQATTGPADSQYLHAHTPSGTGTTLTLAVLRDSSSANLQETYTGVAITEMKYSMKPGEPVMCAVSFLAKLPNIDARGSPTFDTDPPLVMYTTDDYVKYGGAQDSYITAAEVTIARNYPGLSDETAIGSQTRSWATPGLITMEGTMDRVFQEDSAFNEFMGSASAVTPAEDKNTHTLDIRSKSNTLIGAATVYQMNWLADQIVFDTRNCDQSKQDLMVENLAWFAESDGSTDFIAVNVKNSRATYTN